MHARQYEAQRNYFMTGAYLNANPELAYRYNLQAYRAFPLDDLYRLQLFLTLTRWSELEARVRAPLREFDLAYAVSRTASPLNRGLLLARLQHLVTSGRYLAERDEAEAVLASLYRNAGCVPEPYFLEAYLAIELRQWERAGIAISAGQAIAAVIPTTQVDFAALLARLPGEVRMDVKSRPRPARFERCRAGEASRRAPPSSIHPVRPIRDDETAWFLNGGRRSRAGSPPGTSACPEFTSEPHAAPARDERRTPRVGRGNGDVDPPLYPVCNPMSNVAARSFPCSCTERRSCEPPRR